MDRVDKQTLYILSNVFFWMFIISEALDFLSTDHSSLSKYLIRAIRTFVNFAIQDIKTQQEQHQLQLQTVNVNNSTQTSNVRQVEITSSPSNY